MTEDGCCMSVAEFFDSLKGILESNDSLTTFLPQIYGYDANRRINFTTAKVGKYQNAALLSIYQLSSSGSAPFTGDSNQPFTMKSASFIILPMLDSVVFLSDDEAAQLYRTDFATGKAGSVSKQFMHLDAKAAFDGWLKAAQGIDRQ